MVDATDLKSVSFQEYWFKSSKGYMNRNFLRVCFGYLLFETVLRDYIVSNLDFYVSFKKIIFL